MATSDSSVMPKAVRKTYCPNCSVVLLPEEVDGCANCEALFKGAAWGPCSRPSESPVPQRRRWPKNTAEGERQEKERQARERERSERVTLSGTIAAAVVRSLLAAGGAIVVLGLAVLSALDLSALGYRDGGEALIFLALSVAFFLLGWTLLPFFRMGRVSAKILAVFWIALGFSLLPWWIFFPWCIATVGLGLCIKRTPPAFLAETREEHTAKG